MAAAAAAASLVVGASGLVSPVRAGEIELPKYQQDPVSPQEEGYPGNLPPRALFFFYVLIVGHNVNSLLKLINLRIDDFY